MTYIILAIMLIGTSGCTNAIPNVEAIFPTKPPKSKPGNIEATLLGGKFHIKGDSVDEIKSGSLQNESGFSVPLKAETDGSTTTLSPKSDTKIKQGQYKLNMTTGDGQDLGRFYLEIDSGQITLDKITPAPINAFLTTSGGSVVWDMTTNDRISNTVKFNNLKIYAGPDGSPEPPPGAVDLLAYRNQAHHVLAPYGVAVGGEDNFVVANSSIIIGGKSNTAYSEMSAVISSQGVTTLNFNEIVFGGAKLMNNNSPWTSIVHASAVTDGVSLEVLLSLANGANVFRYMNESNGACSVDLAVLPDSGYPSSGDAKIFFKVVPPPAPIVITNKVGNSFQMGNGETLTIEGIPADSNGFIIKLKSMNPLPVGQFTARVICLVSAKKL